MMDVQIPPYYPKPHYPCILGQIPLFTDITSDREVIGEKIPSATPPSSDLWLPHDDLVKRERSQIGSIKESKGL